MTDSLFAFVHIGKTAGTSVHSSLRSVYGPAYLVTSPMQKSSTYRLATGAGHLSRDNLRWLRRISPRLKGVGGHNVRPYVNLGEKVRYATFFRDPIARSISAFTEHDKFENFNDPVEDFCRWLEVPTFRNEQCQMVSGRQSSDEALAAISAFEISYGFQSDLPNAAARVFGEIGVRLTPLKHENVRVERGVELVEMLRSSTIAMDAVRDANSEDLRLYESVKQAPYDRQVSENEKYQFAKGSDARRWTAMAHRMFVHKPLETALQGRY